MDKEINFDKIILELQSKIYKNKSPNSFEPKKAPGEFVFENGVKYVNDIKYDDTYPNSYFDIWYGIGHYKKPTIIYSHGGGMVWGDKIVGDPFAVDNPIDELAFYKDLAKKGYNIVSYNYCFSPDYRAPTQLIQMNIFLNFLMKNKEKFNLDMDNLVFCGGSAGANLSMMYLTAIYNNQYSKQFGFVPIIKKEQVKCAIIDEGTMGCEKNIDNYGLKVLIAANYGTWDLENNDVFNKMLMMKFIKDDYAPCFITASNEEKWFYYSAIGLKEKLDSISIDNDFYYKTIEDSEVLKHGFMGLFNVNKYALECYNKAIDFIEKYVDK